MGTRRKYWTIAGVLAVVLVAAVLAAGVMVPWKQTIGQRLQAMLAARGFEGVTFDLSDIGLHKVTLQDITLGGETPLVLKNLEINYSPRDLWNRNLQDVTLRGLSLEVRKAEDKWVVNGLEHLKNQAGEKAIKIPATAESLAFIPFERMTLEDSDLRVIGPAWQVSVPLKVEWTKGPVPEIKYKASSLTFLANSLNVSTGDIEAVASIQDKDGGWSGNWIIKNAVVAKTSVPVPPLTGAGIFNVLADRILAEGIFKSADNAYRMEFKLEHLLNDPEQSKITIVSTSMPWKGGVISVKNAKVPVIRRGPVRLNIGVSKVSLDELLQSLTGKRVSATGELSGMVPVILNTDGSLTFQAGHLEAISPGSISMPPETIPGDNEQVVLVRDILANLQYSVLSATTSSDKDGKLAVLLSLEGNNPDVYNGRVVKLNVNLTGDLVDFVQQNLMLLKNPETLLEKK